MKIHSKRAAGTSFAAKLTAALILFSVLLGGCATTPKSTWNRTGDPLVDGRSAIALGPSKDKVLWQYRTALTAMRQGNYNEAKSLLDDAILSISNLYGNDKSARQSRRMFSEESKKTFVGEPYERVMAYVYRGILYWMDGEPDNARACFRSAQLIDSDTEDKTYAADYVTLEYLDGYASLKLNADGSEAFQRAQKLSKIGGLPEYNPRANTLLFFEFGEGPMKYASGEHREQLRIRPGTSRVNGAWFKVSNKAVRIGPYDDLNFQATTRGGRVMDHILANKAVFKSTTDNVGNAALLSGIIVGTQGRNDTTAQVGLGLVAAGLLSKIVAASTTPEADTRAWDNLPQYLSFAALELPPGEHTATVEFTDAGGAVIKTKSINFHVPQGEGSADTVLFLSDKS
ncbi:MAG: hypothetical protein SFY81_13620 [Verrucomicrobiota bacterium]|nr:hypothetical protein [Verrucomicrobiota bacterium]